MRKKNLQSPSAVHTVRLSHSSYMFQYSSVCTYRCIDPVSYGGFMSFETACDLLFPASLPLSYFTLFTYLAPIPNKICPLLCHISLPVLCAADATGSFPPWKAFYHNTPTPHGCSILLKLTDRNIRMGEYITLN